MATIRRAGFGSVFEVENEKVGIGTTGNQTNTLQVLGDIKSSDATVIGLSTLTTYQGFVDKEARFGKALIDVESQAGTLGEIVIEGDVTVSSASTLTSSVNQLTLTDSFSVPTGNTDSRIHCHTAGSMRFNEDLGTLEFYTGDEWKTVNSFKDTGNRGRAIFSTNQSGSPLDFVNISSQGNAKNFGDFTGTSTFGCSSETRGVWAGGYNNPNFVIEYITIASEGNTITFGDLSVERKAVSATSSSTRGMWAGGYAPTGGGSPNRTNTIQYVEIQTLGDSVDFGDLTTTEVSMAAASSPTRGIFSGGYTLPSQYDVVTIASKGNATRFGDMKVPRARHACCSNSTRGVFGAGRQVNNSQLTTEIEYITIASEGSATYFGDITAKRNMLAAASSQTRGLFAGGYNHPSNSGDNTIDFITFSSTGNAIDFGDCIEAKRGVSGISDSHGGLGGF